MTTKTLHILALEDNDLDHQVLLAELHRSNIVHNLTRVATKNDFLREINDHLPDVILSDFSLRGFDGISALRIAREINPLIPFIILARSVGEESLVECMKQGAWDYVPKHNIRRIGSAIDAVMELRNEKQRNADLQNEFLKLSRAVETADDSIVITDNNGVIEYVNEAFVRRTGYSANEAIGKTPAMLNSGHHPEEFFEELWRTILAGKPFHAEFLNRRKDGETYYQDETISPIVNSQGRVTNFVSTGRDVTGRKVAESLLRKSEQKFKDIFDYAPAGIYQATVDGTILMANQSLARILGYDSSKDLVGINLTEQVYLDKADRIELVQHEESEGHVSNVELHWKKKNGSKIWVHLNAHTVRDADGKTQYFEGFVRDITERRLSEENLKASEERYRRLFEDAVLGIFQTSVDGKIIEVNPAFARMFGYESPAEVKTLVHDIGSDLCADPEQWLEIIHRIETSPNLRSFENLYKKKDGSTFTGMLHLRRIEGDGGRDPHYEGMIEDISERKRSEDALRDSEFWIRESQRVGRIGSYVTDFVTGSWRSSEVLDEIFGIDDKYVRNIEGWLKLVHPEHHKEMEEYLKEIIAKRKPFDKNYRIVRVSDHQERWVSGHGELTFDDDGRVLTMIGTIQDITEQKRAEEGLRLTKEFSENVIQTANVLFLQLDPVGRILKLNKAAEEITGYNRAEVEGKNWFDAIVPRERYPYVWQEYLKILKLGGATRVFENPIVTKSGEERQILWKNSVLHEGRKITGTISFGMDITERKQSEQALKETAESFASLFNSTLDGIVIHENGKILDANKSVIRLSGYELRELIGKDVVELVGEESRSLVIRYLSQEYEKPFDALGRRKDGLIVPVELTTTGISFHGRQVRLTGIREISERKRAEEALRASEDRFRTIYENSPIGIANVDRNGKFIRANRALQQIFGYEERELQSLSFNDITYPEDKDVGSKELDDFLGGRKDLAEIEKRYVHQNGSLIWAHLTISTVRDTQGVLLYTVTIVEDITARRNAEERQKILEVQLAQAQKMEAIGRLAGGIAHDFNNILGIILGHLSILQRPEFDASLRANSFETITKAVQRGASLVRQILTFARKTKASPEQMNVTALVHELVKMLRETFPKTIDIVVEEDSFLPPIKADQTQFHQALMNLCINARDAMMDLDGSTLARGKLTIRLIRISGMKLRTLFPDVSASEYVGVAVSDTGPGMDESTKQKIFEPFFTTKGTGKGTGLGLAVVYGVVKSHQGFVDVESTIGSGTTFTLYFPAGTSYVLPEDIAPLIEPISLKGTESILLVEDEEGLLTLMQMALERNGYTVFPAKDGIEAIETFEKHRKQIALVLTDMGLPKLDGSEMFTMLKMRDPDVKVILASGYLEPNYKRELLKAGAKDFVQKPYETEEVLKKIRAILDRK